MTQTRRLAMSCVKQECVARCTLAAVAALLTACATPPEPAVSAAGVHSAGVPGAGLPSTGVAYRCDQGEDFIVVFGNNAAVLTGPRGRQELLRDAGGLTPQQTVYSNAQLRAEFGLGAGGRQALLRTLKTAAVVRCVRN